MSADPTSEFVYKPTSNVPAQILERERAKLATVPDLINSLPVAIVANVDEQEAYDAILAAQNCAAVKNGQSAGVMLAEPLRARAGCVAAILGALVISATWEGVKKRTGLEYQVVALLARWDKPGFGALLAAAEAERDRRLVDRLRGAVMDRAINGVDEPVIGRVGKDQDGIITTRKRHSDKLAEFALSRLDKDTFGEQSAVTSIGQQVIYNIQAFGSPIPARQPAQEAEIVTEDAEDGENTAKINMDSIVDVDSP